jgi:hypothetical protein
MDMENAYHWANKNLVSTLTLSFAKMEKSFVLNMGSYLNVINNT